MIDQNDPRLTSYVLGELSSSEAAEIEQAISESPQLASAVEEIRGMVGLLGDAYVNEEKLGLSDEQKVAIAQNAPINSGSSRRWISLAIAACLGAVLIGGWVLVANDYYRNDTRRSSQKVAVVDRSITFSDAGQADRSKYLGVRLRGGTELTEDVVAESDFEPMIELIQGTIESDGSPFLPTDGNDIQFTQGSFADESIAYHSRYTEDLWNDIGLPNQNGEPRVQWRDLGKSPGRINLNTFPPVEDEAGDMLQSLLGADKVEIVGNGQDDPELSVRAERAREQFIELMRARAANASSSAKGEAREKAARAQQLANLESQSREINKQLSERRWEMQQQSEADGDANPASSTAAFEAKLTESKAVAELVRQKVGTGHPDYELAIAEVRGIEAKLAERENDVANSTTSQFTRVRTSLQQVLVSFKKVDELKKSGSLEDRRNTLVVLRAKLDEMEYEASKLEQRLGSGHPGFAVIREQIENLKKSFANEKIAFDTEVSAKPKSWKRVKAIPNTTRLMVGDKEELSLNGMQVNAQVDGFRARVLVDYFYYNDRERQLEGNFKLRLPDDASLYYFAFGESAYGFSPEGKLAGEEFLSDGTQFVSLRAQDVKEARKGQWDNVKEARMVPKEKAAHAFRETVRRRVDPALVEWSGAGVFNAKVFPLAPKKLHRIVVGYDVNLKRSKDGLKFELSLPEQTGQCGVEVNVKDLEGVSYSVTPEVDPVPTAIEGKLQKRFVFQNDEQPLSKIELSVNGTSESVLRSSNEDGDFWTVQTTPDLPAEEGSLSSRAIFMLDTSLSTSPDKFNVWLKLLESTLNNNRGSLNEFNVLFFNVDQHFWKDNYVANTPENVAALKTTLENLALEGATDLYGAVQALADAKWAGDEANQPDLFLLSDGAATWGETDLRLINQRLQQSQLGSLFAYQTGLSGTAISGLRFLAGQSGGAVFSVATEDEIKTASTAHRKRPWQLKSIAAAGASDILTAGRVQWVYPGQTLTIVGRGNVEESIELKFQQGNESKAITLTPTTIESQLASRMYGHVAVGQLESLGSQVFDVSAAYARHFRITGRTCSLLMLESEADYQRFDIKPQEDLFVVKAKSTSKLVAETLEKFAEQLVDPKAKLLAWLDRLESMPGMEFKMPTALKLAMDDIKVDAISQSMECSLATKEELSESYLKAIGLEHLDYDAISAEANRRAVKSVDDSIKVYSSLVERNPGDIIVARDVAFTAMELERPATAFHLLRRVAQARPFQGNIYPAIGQCLAQLGKGDMAIVYYEIAMNGTFQRQGNEFKQIVATEYIHLLRQIVSGKVESSVKDFAAARLQTLGKHLPFGTADVVITMMWNQDQTDVDLHVVEPSGEECFYKHNRTKSGGAITSDITTGFGPEMYFNANAPRGKYQLKAKFFGSGQNRTSTRNKVYMTIIRGFGTEEESMTRRTIQLETVGEKMPVMSMEVE
ncbi:hypothetical protein [Mariniblastus fucicola]|uniref:Vault protein inter-alpha-trypsin n=1 Tax=Mariniblastus fucicola TaxID=980251 RepID=A0A5B9P5U9_9BACT|nr:hypothetical protein [Mariniblastus fucicola]QEG20555.1 hypothetical protein MFFC18_04040 [Mariniblastus fucicola]